MRLNCALVSSFLFVPIVLADSHPENHWHQPRFLNKKNINDASDNNPAPWAGAALLAKSNEACHFRTSRYYSNTGTFPVPLVWGANGSNFTGVSITVGIGNLQACAAGVAFVAGIDVELIDNVVVNTVRAQWGSHIKSTPNFTVVTGDIVRATINVDRLYPTTGWVILENLFNPNVSFWTESFVAEPEVCQQSAEWVVAPINFPTDAMLAPKFSTVTIMNATAKTVNGTSVTQGVNVVDMGYDNMTLATTMADLELKVVVVGYASDIY